MRSHSLTFFLALFFIQSSVNAQNNNCSGALTLCANSTVTSSTSGATAGSGDVLDCGDNTVTNNVWFTLTATSTGTATVTVNDIGNSNGLAMEIFTGTCGSLTGIGQCTTGTPSTGGTMSLTFPTTTGTTYYVMVDGQSGNQESFTIIATSSSNSIVARPSADFITNPSFGCAPLTTLLDNTSVLYGGSNITYSWSLDSSAFITGSGSDTTVTFTTPGIHTASLRVCNAECGCKSILQEIVVQELSPSISFVPPIACVGSPISFFGSASVLPDPPYTDPNVTDWTWNFDDPNSGSNNIVQGQNVDHIFVGPQTFFNVTLTVDGTCGPQTTNLLIDLNPQPEVTISANSPVCEGSPAFLTTQVTGGAPGYFFDWSGSGNIICSFCPNTTVDGLTGGNNYDYIVTVTDNLGCTDSDTATVTVNPIPVVSTPASFTACRGEVVQLSSTIVTGNGGFSYDWSPGTGLNDSTSANPSLTVVSDQTYCVTVTDAAGCSSAPACTDVTLRPPPVVVASNPSICSSDPNPQTSFTVNGAGAGSTYSWGRSPSYSLITGANADSSRVDVTFPTGSATTFVFSVIVTDGVNGCIDTVAVPFTIYNGVNVTISGPLNTCAGAPVTLVANGAATFQWSSTPAYPFSDPTLASQLVTPAVTTTFTVVGTSGICTQVVPQILVIRPAPPLTVDPITPVCGCDTVSLSASSSVSGATFSWTGSGTLAYPNAAATAAYACPGDSFRVRVVDPANSCFKDSTIFPPALAPPAATASLFPPIICPGATTSIDLQGTGSATGSGYSYLWSSSNPSVIIQDTTALNTTADVSQSTVFFLTVTDAYGCDSTTSDTVSVQPPPIIFTATPFLCTSSPNLQATLSIVGADNASTYIWNTIPSCVSPGSTTSQSETFDFSSCSTGSFTFNVTVDDPVSGCTSNISQQVSVVNGVVLTTTDDTTICEGSNLNLVASGANTYSWNNGQTGGTLAVNGLSASGSPYNFTVFGTIGNCTASHTVVVTVLPAPVTSAIAGPDTLCGNSTGITYSVTPSAGNYVWNVQGGTIQSGQGTGAILVDWGTGTSGTVSVFDSNTGGCPGNTQSLTVVLGNTPILAPSINGPSTLCQSQNGTYSVNATPGSTFTWQVTGGTITGSNQGTSIDVQWPASGNGTVSVTETSSTGCSGPSGTLNVSIGSIGTSPTLDGPLQVCQGATLEYTTVANPGSFYTWTPNGGVLSSSTFNGDTVTITWPNAGNYTLSVLETNAGGCSSNPTVRPVVVTPQPTVNILTDTLNACQLANVTMLASAPFGVLAWTTSGSGTFSDSTTASTNYQLGPSDTAVVVLTLTATSAGCPSDTGLVIVQVIDAPTVTLTASSDSVCEGLPVSITATGGGTYNWYPGGATSATIVVSPSASTTYTVSVTNAAGCVTVDSIHLGINPAGLPQAGDDIIACLGFDVPLSGSQQFATGLVWSTSGDGYFTPSDTDPNATYQPGVNDTTSRSTFIYLTTTGACRDNQDTLLITYDYVPTVYAGPDTILSSGFASGVSLSLNPTVQHASGVVWSTSGTGFFSPSDTSILAVYEPSSEDFNLDSIVITVTATGGCQPVADYLVIEFTPLVIPNVFTPYPASPGQNDYFVIQQLPRNSQLKIWDRWGVLVFESADYQNNWDAANLRADTFYYILNSRGKSFHGWVEVIREER